MPVPPPSSRPVPATTPARRAAFAVALLIGCVNATVVYWCGTILLGLPLPLVVALSLSAQAAWQVDLAHRILGAPRAAWPWHAAYVAPSWVAVGALYARGASAFYAHATLVLTVMVAGGALCAAVGVRGARRSPAPVADGRRQEVDRPASGPVRGASDPN